MAVSIGVSLLSSLLAPKPKKLKTDSLPTSAFGADIPRIFGIARVPTTVIYASKVREIRSGGKGGATAGKGGKQRSRGDCCVIIGEGERTFNQYLYNGSAYTGKLKLRRIFLQDKIWADYTAQATPDLIADTARREQYFEFYDGSLTQNQDPTLVARLGAANVSSYRGLCYLVFNNLWVHDFGHNYPTIKVEVEADIPPTLKAIASDVMFRAGRRQGRPLIENADYTFAANLGPGPTIDGYILSQDVSDYRQELANILQLFRVSLIRSTGAWNYATNPGIASATDPRFIRRARNVSPTLMFVPAAGQNQRVNQDMSTGASTELYKIPQTYAHEYKDADRFPSELQLSYIQPRLDFEREVVVASRASQGLGDTLSLSMNMVIQDRRVASKIAVYLIREGWNRVNTLKYSTTTPIENGYVYTIPGFKVLPTQLEIGADGRTSVISVITGDAEGEDVGDNDFVLAGGTDQSGTPPMNIIWTDGQSLDNAATRSAQIMLAPRIGYRALADAPGTLMYSIDGGATYSDLGVELDSNALLVNMAVTVAPSLPPRTDMVDYGAILTLTLPPDIQLTSITMAQLWDKTNNMLYIEGFGMLSFQYANAIAANTYEVSGLRWSIDDTLKDQPFNPTFPPRAWLLLARPYSVPIPNSVSPGTSLTIAVLDEGNDIAATYVRTFRNANQMPRPTTEGSAFITSAGGIDLRWTNGLNQNSGTAAALFEDDVPIFTSQLIYVYNYVGGVYTLIGTPITAASPSSHSFSPAQVAGFGVPVSNLAFAVVPTNALGTVTPDPNTWAFHLVDPTPL